MKKTAILPILALTALLATGCGKERNCECTVEDLATNYNPTLVIDNGMKCSDITEMAIEDKYVDSLSGAHLLHRIEVHKVSCRDQRQ